MVPNPLNLPDGGDSLQAVGFEIVLDRYRVGDLVLPTGRLVACDPLTMPETEPFAVQVPTGTFPVYAIAAELRDRLRTAYAVIEFSEARPTRWEIAHLAGEDPSNWKGERSAFHVDSNVAAIMDDQTVDVLLHLVQYTDDEEEEIEKRIRRDMRRNHRSGMQLPVADVDLDPRNGGNLVAFDTDAGSYVTYFGFDEAGDVAMVALDFDVLDYRFTPYGLRY